MAQLESERAETKIELRAYDEVLKLTAYSLDVCKPKSKKNNDGSIRESNHHIPMRFSKMGETMMDSFLRCGGYVLEANELYVGANINDREKILNFKERISLQTKSISILYFEEHCIRTINDHRKFADSTLTYWTHLLIFCIQQAE